MPLFWRSGALELCFSNPSVEVICAMMIQCLGIRRLGTNYLFLMAVHPVLLIMKKASMKLLHTWACQIPAQMHRVVAVTLRNIKC
jgi:hypothetical protein